MKLPDCDPPLPSQELIRWRRRTLGLALIVALIILGAAWVGRGLPLRSPGRIALALLQGVASTVLIVAIARPIRLYDELQRRIQLEAIAIAFTATAILATTYGFLVKAGLPDIDWGEWIWPAMTGLWAIGLTIACRRYK